MDRKKVLKEVLDWFKFICIIAAIVRGYDKLDFRIELLDYRLTQIEQNTKHEKIIPAPAVIVPARLYNPKLSIANAN